MFTKLHSFPTEFNEDIVAFLNRKKKMSGNFIIVATFIRRDRKPEGPPPPPPPKKVLQPSIVIQQTKWISVAGSVTGFTKSRRHALTQQM